MDMGPHEACDRPEHPNSPALLKKIVTTYKTVAVVGISKKEDRDSHRVAAYLKAHGFKLVPVNPQLDEVLGEKCYARLADIPFPVDVVDVFRKPSALVELAEEIIPIKPKAVWFQLGVVNNEAARKLEQAGIEVVQNACIKIEHALLS